MVGQRFFAFESMLDLTSSTIALLEEVDDSNMPIELGDDENSREGESQRSLQVKRLRSRDQAINVEISNSKNVDRQLDSGDTIDVLCLYTRQALIERCQASPNGKDCSNNYSNYIASMNEKCQFAVHQTVREIKFLSITDHIISFHLTCIIFTQKCH